jgi:RNAse (barnase) inhibitor barstar
MPLQALQSLIDARRGGVHFLDAHVEPRKLQALARKAGFAFFHLEGKTIERKEQLMNAMATALSLPSHFGHNWDALEECLGDMEGVEGKGAVLYYDHIDGLLAAHPDQFETLVEIVRDAVEAWKEDGTAMVVILSGTKAPKGVAKLSAA